jgi:hypothetical protein
MNKTTSANALLEDDPQLFQGGSKASDDQWTEVHGIRETEESFGRIDIEDEQPNYVGSTHWAAILDNLGPPHLPPPPQTQRL